MPLTQNNHRPLQTFYTPPKYKIKKGYATQLLTKQNKKKKKQETQRFHPTSLLWSRPFSDTSLPTYCFLVPFPVWSPTQPGCWVSQPGSWCLTGTTPCGEGCRKKQRARERDREGEKRESKVSLEFTQAYHKQKGRECQVVTVTVWGEFA